MTLWICHTCTAYNSSERVFCHYCNMERKVMTTKTRKKIEKSGAVKHITMMIPPALAKKLNDWYESTRLRSRHCQLALISHWLSLSPKARLAIVQKTDGSGVNSDGRMYVTKKKAKAVKRATLRKPSAKKPGKAAS